MPNFSFQTSDLEGMVWSVCSSSIWMLFFLYKVIFILFQYSFYSGDQWSDKMITYKKQQMGSHFKCTCRQMCSGTIQFNNTGLGVDCGDPVQFFKVQVHAGDMQTTSALFYPVHIIFPLSRCLLSNFLKKDFIFH